MASCPSVASSHRTSNNPFQNASCISTSMAYDGGEVSSDEKTYVKCSRNLPAALPTQPGQLHITSGFT
jgi:hypothetical protein